MRISHKFHFLTLKMEDLQSMTPRKRKRIEWWQNHKPENQKIRKKSHIGYKKKVKKDVQEKAIPEEGASAQDESNSKTENEGKQDKRYILFIGNMPYTVKEEDVKWHFRCTGKGSIKDFRLMTKKTGESKGCGFIEFNNKESYWKALNLHHSTLDGRKINVEITCGGGGKGQTRKKKLEERKTKFLRGRKRKSKSTKVIPKSMDNSAADTNNSDK